MQQDVVPHRVDVSRLRVALDSVDPQAWSQPSRYAATRVHQGYRQVTGPVVDEAFAWLLEQFDPIESSWLSWIDPGGFIVPHVDRGPYFERWQIPIRTAGTTVVADEILEITDGAPFRVQHWRPHWVQNQSATPRVHLLVNRDRMVLSKPSPFQTFPPPPCLLQEIKHASSPQ